MTSLPPRAPRQKASTRQSGRGGGGAKGAASEPLARVNLPSPPVPTPRRRGSRAPITLRAEAAGGGHRDDEEEEDEGDAKVRVHFPSARTVRRSRGGPDAAGTITFRAEWHARGSFPRGALHDHASARAGMLSHAKVLLAHAEGGGGGDGERGTTAWAYVGSANLSTSAWGRVVRDRASGEARLDVANWECGVLVPVPPAEEPDGAAFESGRRGNAGGEARLPLHEDGARLRRLFAPVLDVPFELPGKRYGPGDEPWFFMRHRGGGH